MARFFRGRDAARVEPKSVAESLALLPSPVVSTTAFASAIWPLETLVCEFVASAQGTCMHRLINGNFFQHKRKDERSTSLLCYLTSPEAVQRVLRPVLAQRLSGIFMDRKHRHIPEKERIADLRRWNDLAQTKDSAADSE